MGKGLGPGRPTEDMAVYQESRRCATSKLHAESAEKTEKANRTAFFAPSAFSAVILSFLLPFFAEAPGFTSALRPRPVLVCQFLPG
jgi:hypothetical protein